MTGIIEARQRLDSQSSENELVLKVGYFSPPLTHSSLLLSPPLSSPLPNCIPLSFSLSLCLVASVDSWSVASSRLTPSDCFPQEITLLKPHNTVYKLVGPSLVPQDQGEARVNVEKRLEYIRSEVYVCSAIHAIDSRKGGESRWT